MASSSTSSTRLLCRAVSVLTLLAATASCDDATGPKGKSQIGVIAFYGDPVVITVPDTVLVGEPFSVSVRTYGDGCTSEDGTEVESANLSFHITPYDVHRGRICTSVLMMFDHATTLAATQSGTARITFHGRQLPEDIALSEVREVVVR